jgi:hypothetical protein
MNIEIIDNFLNNEEIEQLSIILSNKKYRYASPSEGR